MSVALPSSSPTPLRPSQVRTQLDKVRAELEAQSQHTTRLESGCRSLERSLCQSGQRLEVSSF